MINKNTEKTINWIANATAAITDISRASVDIG
jgi:hypothetical protein